MANKPAASLPHREYRVVRLIGNGLDPGSGALSEEAKTFAVVICFPEHPGWWRVVAYFHNYKRAEKYAGIENDCMDDEKDYDGDNTEVAPPGAGPEPESWLNRLKPAADIPEIVTYQVPEVVVPSVWMPPIPEAVTTEEPAALEPTPEPQPIQEPESAKPADQYVPWVDQDELLRQLVIDDVPIPEMARRLDRSEGAVRTRISAKQWARLRGTGAAAKNDTQPPPVAAEMIAAEPADTDPVPEPRSFPLNDGSLDQVEIVATPAASASAAVTADEVADLPAAVVAELSKPAQAVANVGGRPTNMWPVEKVFELRRLRVEECLTLAECAVRLGEGYTKSMVIGKAQRLGLQTREVEPKGPAPKAVPVLDASKAPPLKNSALSLPSTRLCTDCQKQLAADHLGAICDSCRRNRALDQRFNTKPGKPVLEEKGPSADDRKIAEPVDAGKVTKLPPAFAEASEHAALHGDEARQRIQGLRLEETGRRPGETPSQWFHRVNGPSA